MGIIFHVTPSPDSSSSSSPIILRPQLSHKPALIPPLQILRQFPIHQLGKLLRLGQRHPRTLQQRNCIHRRPTQLRNLANLTMPIQANRTAPHPHLLLQPRRIQQRRLPFLTEKAPRYAERRVQPAQRDRLPLGGGIHRQHPRFHARVGLAEVPQRGDDGDARRVDQVAVMRERMHVDADGPTFLAGHQAEGFGVEGAGAADRLFEEAGEEDFGLGRAVRLEGGRGHGAELGRDGEDAVEGAVGVGDGYFGGGFGEDSGGRPDSLERAREPEEHGGRHLPRLA